jgi:hypothetical protein
VAWSSGASAAFGPRYSSAFLFFEFGRDAVEAARERQLAPADGSTADDAVPAAPRSTSLREAAFGAVRRRRVVMLCHSRSFGRWSAAQADAQAM